MGNKAKPESYDEWREKVHDAMKRSCPGFYGGKTGRRRDFFFECFGIFNFKGSR